MESLKCVRLILNEYRNSHILSKHSSRLKNNMHSMIPTLRSETPEVNAQQIADKVFLDDGNRLPFLSL